MLFTVVIVRIVCVAVNFQVMFKCDYENEAYNSVHKIQHIHISYTVVLGTLILLSGALCPNHRTRSGSYVEAVLCCAVYRYVVVMVLKIVRNVPKHVILTF